MYTITVDCSKPTGKKPKPVNGLCNGPISNSGWTDKTEDFRELGVPFVRLHDTDYAGTHCFVDISRIFVNFDADENDPSSYQFQHTDQLIKAIYAAGAQPVYRLGESIDHSIYKRAARPPRDIEKWARICVQIIRHYNDGWAEGFRYGIKYWEIWNEPDCFNPDGTSPMWSGGTQQQAFSLYRCASAAIKAYDRNLMVGGMAFTCYNAYAEEFIKFCAENKLALDFISYHIYTDKISEIEQLISSYDKFLLENGFLHTERILDEWNYFGDEAFEGVLWDACRTNPHVAKRLYENQKSEVGASFAAAAMIRMNDMPLDIAAYYDSQPAMHWCGLYDTYGIRQKTYHAFRAYGKLYQSQGTLVETRTEAEGIYALACRDEARTLVLISNFGGQDGSIALSLRGLGEQEKSAELYLLDDEYDLAPYRKEVFHGDQVVQTLRMKNHSVALIEII